MERPIFDMTASGYQMRLIRRQRNISVKEVAEYMGFESTQAVYKWEAGKCYPQADNLIALAMLYKVSPMELIVGEEKEASPIPFYGYYLSKLILINEKHVWFSPIICNLSSPLSKVARDEKNWP